MGVAAVNDGSGKFRDISAASGIGAASLPYTGWGTAWFDFDNDTWLDLLSVNGPIVANQRTGNQPFPYDQRKVLFRNLGDRRFENVTERAGRAFDFRVPASRATSRRRSALLALAAGARCC